LAIATTILVFLESLEELQEKLLRNFATSSLEVS